MKCLVIGYGSIGQRHARVLHEIGNAVAFVTKADKAVFPFFSSIEEGVEKWLPEYVVIANDTRMHAKALSQLAKLNYVGVTLVEKPLVSNTDELVDMPSGPIFVGYTLRFHPLIQRLSELVSDASLWTFTAYVGQYLPDWRPERDYRQSYSARKEDGGVIRDLSHELDYAQLLAGRCTRTVVAGGHFSTLEIDSEDAATLVAECDRCPLVSVHVNYLDRTPSRWIVVNGSMGSVKVDFIKGVLAVNSKETGVQVERDAMIRDQHIAAISGDISHLCTIDNALDTMRWIAAAHKSIDTSSWVDV